MTVDPTGRLVTTGASEPTGLGAPRLPPNISVEQFKRIISTTGSLPRVPPTAVEIMELVGREDTSVAALADVVSSEPSLANRILEMANSVFYSFDQRITALSHAIVILGFRAVQSMAIADSSRSLFGRGTKLGHKERGLWEHSIGCAMSCRQVARVVGYRPEESAFVTGLIHDLGKAVLIEALPRRYGRIVAIAEGEGRASAEVESEMLGFDHSHIGALIALQWGFSWEVVEAIGAHHDADVSARGGRLAAILAVSNDISRGVAMTPEASDERPASENWGARSLSLDEKACRRVREMVREIVEVERKLYAL